MPLGEKSSALNQEWCRIKVANCNVYQRSTIILMNSAEPHVMINAYTSMVMTHIPKDSYLPPVYLPPVSAPKTSADPDTTLTLNQDPPL